MDKASHNFTPIDQIDAYVAHLRVVFESRKTLSISWRRQQLEGIIRMLDEQENTIKYALQKDLKKSSVEVFTSIAGIRKEAEYALKHLKRWTARRKVKTPLFLKPGKSWVQPEPLGVVLCITAWNFPWYQSLVPMIGALSAGNCILVKPSEFCLNSAKAIADIYPQYIDPDAVIVVQGGPEETKALLRNQFDHILYTGNQTIAKSVMAAAARYLTPVTLELGGKCPAIVDQKCDIKVTARRLVWAKFQSAGQICITVDHVFVHKSKKAELICALKEEIRKEFGEYPEKSSDYGRIINKQKHERLVSLLNNEKIIFGGHYNQDDLYLEPTVVENPSFDSPLMTEEIFGPILPIVEWEKEEYIYDWLYKNNKPLALYIFSDDTNFQNRVLDHTTSGNVVVNDLMFFMLVPELPFGGVGASGMGAYKGFQGFSTFSHLKSVLKRGKFMDFDVRYAPYDSKKEKIMRFLWG